MHVVLGRSVLAYRVGRLDLSPLGPEGQTRLAFTGPEGLAYTLQRSTHLPEWVDVLTFTHTRSTAWTNPPPAPGAGFYRTVLAPAP